MSKLPGGITFEVADIGGEFAEAVKRIDVKVLRSIYGDVARRVEREVESHFKIGTKYSTGKPVHRWGKNVFVRNIERTVETFANIKNPDKAYVVVGPKNINSGSDRGTPVHHMFINGFRAKRGSHKAVARIRAAQVNKMTKARALESATNNYPHKPAYDQSNAVAVAMFRAAFFETDNEVVKALRTKFNVT
jgi:hypothetical protein